MPNYTGTDTVKNKLGAKTHDEPESLEAEFGIARIYEIQNGYDPKSRFDTEHLEAIHWHLLRDVYEWAGHTRDEQVRLSDGTVATEPTMHKLGEKDVLPAPLISAALDKIADDLRRANFLRGLPLSAGRTKSDIPIGKTADLPTPHPAGGEIFTVQPTPWGAGSGSWRTGAVSKPHKCHGARARQKVAPRHARAPCTA